MVDKQSAHEIWTVSQVFYTKLKNLYVIPNLAQMGLTFYFVFLSIIQEYLKLGCKYYVEY